MMTADYGTGWVLVHRVAVRWRPLIRWMQSEVTSS